MVIRVHRMFPDGFHMTLRSIGFILCAAVGLFACKKGTPEGNRLPETALFLDSISLNGTSRLNTVIDLHWLGADQDGYVPFFEYSLDQINWRKVIGNDSTFNFTLTPGSDTTDIDFWIRSVDNIGDRDPSPAYLRIPIRNTAPVVEIDTVQEVNDTMLSVFSVLWQTADLDGEETLDSIFIRMNNGAWVPLARTTTLVTIIPMDPGTAGSGAGTVYLGMGAAALSTPIQDVRVDAENVLFIKVRDISGAYSAVDSTKRFFLRRKTSDLLVVDTHGAITTPTPESVYFPALTTAYGTFDHLDLIRNSGALQPAFWDPTFSLLMQLYDKVFWYSDDATFSGQMLLEIASTPINKYLNAGGKLLISAKFNNTTFPVESPVYAFSPMDSLSTSIGQARLNTGSAVYPVSYAPTAFDTLFSSATITSADPFYVADTSMILFRGVITPIGGWTGPSTIIAKGLYSNGKTNQVFCSVELHRLNASVSNLETFLNVVLNQEFNW